MDYVGNVIRPPSEADSIILQVTVGCSHNRCAFCGTYRGEPFRLKDEKTVAADLEFAATHCRRQKRVFLADGDVLSLPQARLVALLSLIREKLSWVKRISLYSNAKNGLRKSVADLEELKDLGLHRVYMGLESGDDETLAAIEKGVTAAQQIGFGQRVREAGLFLSATVLLGLAGRERSLVHAMATGRALSVMQPNQVGVLTLMLLPNTPLYDQGERGVFNLPDRDGMLAELSVLVENIETERMQLQTNHASNYLPINCRLPKDKEQVLAAIKGARAGKIPLKPEHLRAL